MAEERKATDVLLSIEQKIDESLLIQKNQEFLLKTVLSRLGNQSVAPPAPTTSSFLPPKNIEEKQMPGIKPGIKFPGLKGSVVSAEQQIQYFDGKPVALANVEIFKKNGNDLEIVKAMRTNSAGKWMANLESGEYTISLMKQSTGQRSQVNVNFDVKIPESDTLVKLDDYKIK